MNKEIQFGRVLGCLYGQALGDTMGMPSELWPLQKVRSYFGWIDSFLDGPEENDVAKEYKAGQFTDDTSQAIALMDAIIYESGRIVPKTVGRFILEWAEKENAFEKNILGPTSKAALIALNSGKSIDEIESNGVTNGASMRVAPVGCCTSTLDKENFINNVVNSCIPTHKSDIAIAGAAVVAWAVSRAVDGTSWDEIKLELSDLADDIQELYLSTYSPLLSRRIKLALDTVGKIADKKTAIEEIYNLIGAGVETIQAVPAVIALVEVAETKPNLCAELAANLGGDTDTIGAMACAICGALNGIESIDKASIKLIKKANNIDLNYYAEKMLEFRVM